MQDSGAIDGERREPEANGRGSPPEIDVVARDTDNTLRYTASDVRTMSLFVAESLSNTDKR